MEVAYNTTNLPGVLDFVESTGLSFGSNSSVKTILDEITASTIKDVLKVSPSAKALVIKEALTVNEQSELARLYQNYQFEFQAQRQNGHAFAAAARVVEANELLNLAGYTKEGRNIVDIGGNFSAHFTAGRYNVHSCCPCENVRDNGRWVERMIKLRDLNARQCVAYQEIHQVATGEMKSSSIVCKQLAQECDFQADIGIALHSIYDISLENMHKIMLKKNMKMCYATCMFDSRILTNSSGVNKTYGYKWQFLHDGRKNIIRFSFLQDGSLVYDHDLYEYLRWFSRSHYTAKGKTMLIELLNNADGVQYIKMILMDAQGVDLLSHTVWLPHLSDKVRIKLFHYDYNSCDKKIRRKFKMEDGTRVFNTKMVSHEMDLEEVNGVFENTFLLIPLLSTVTFSYRYFPKEFIQKILDFAFGHADNKFTPVEIFKTIRSYANIQVSGKYLLSKDEDIDGETLFDLAFSLYLWCYEKKYKNGMALHHVMKDMENNRKLFSRGIFGKMFTRNTNDHERWKWLDWIHRTLYRLHKSGIDYTDIITSAPDSIVFNHYTTTLFFSGKTPKHINFDQFSNESFDKSIAGFVHKGVVKYTKPDKEYQNFSNKVQKLVALSKFVECSVSDLDFKTRSAQLIKRDESLLYEGGDNAYNKLREIFSASPNLLNSRNALDLCAAPGGFVKCMLERNINVHYHYYEGENCPKMYNDIKFKPVNSVSVDMTDERSLTNLLYYCGKYELVTADGCVGDDLDKESANFSILKNQIKVALEVLENGGSLVVKVFAANNSNTVRELINTTAHFERFYLIRPASSRPTSTEFYACFECKKEKPGSFHSNAYSYIHMFRMDLLDTLINNYQFILNRDFDDSKKQFNNFPDRYLRKLIDSHTLEQDLIRYKFGVNYNALEGFVRQVIELEGVVGYYQGMLPLLDAIFEMYDESVRIALGAKFLRLTRGIYGLYREGMFGDDRLDLLYCRLLQKYLIDNLMDFEGFVNTVLTLNLNFSILHKIAFAIVKILQFKLNDNSENEDYVSIMNGIKVHHEDFIENDFYVYEGYIIDTGETLYYRAENESTEYMQINPIVLYDSGVEVQSEIFSENIDSDSESGIGSIDQEVEVGSRLELNILGNDIVNEEEEENKTDEVKFELVEVRSENKEDMIIELDGGSKQNFDSEDNIIQVGGTIENEEEVNIVTEEVGTSSVKDSCVVVNCKNIRSSGTLISVAKDGYCCYTSACLSSLKGKEYRDLLLKKDVGEECINKSIYGDCDTLFYISRQIGINFCVHTEVGCLDVFTDDFNEYVCLKFSGFDKQVGHYDHYLYTCNDEEVGLRQIKYEFVGIDIDCVKLFCKDFEKKFDMKNLPLKSWRFNVCNRNHLCDKSYPSENNCNYLFPRIKLNMTLMKNFYKNLDIKFEIVQFDKNFVILRLTDGYVDNVCNLCEHIFENGDIVKMDGVNYVYNNNCSVYDDPKGVQDADYIICLRSELGNYMSGNTVTVHAKLDNGVLSNAKDIIQVLEGFDILNGLQKVSLRSDTTMVYKDLLTWLETKSAVIYLVGFPDNVRFSNFSVIDRLGDGPLVMVENAISEYIQIQNATAQSVKTSCVAYLKAFKEKCNMNMKIVAAGVVYKVEVIKGHVNSANRLIGKFELKDYDVMYCVSINALVGEGELIDMPRTDRKIIPSDIENVRSLDLAEGSYYLVATHRCKIKLYNKLSAAATLQLNKKTIPKLKFIEGVPGMGKTYKLIKEHNSETDIITTASIEAKDDLIKRIRENRRRTDGDDDEKEKDIEDVYAERYRTLTSLLLNPTDCEKLYVDEALMSHFGMVMAAARACNCTELIMIGDRAQIPYHDYNGTTKLKYSVYTILPSNCVEVEFCNLSRRIPMDVCALVNNYMRNQNGNKMYDKEIRTTSKVDYSVSRNYIRSVNAVEYKENVDYLCFTRDDVQLLESHFTKLQKPIDRIHTINGFQGKQNSEIRLVRLNTKGLILYEAINHILVATTRHTEKFTYYTVSLDDKLGKLISRLENCSRNDILKYGVNTVGGGQLKEYEVMIEPGAVRHYLEERPVFRNMVLNNGFSGVSSFKPVLVEIETFDEIEDFVSCDNSSLHYIEIMQMYADEINSASTLVWLNNVANPVIHQMFEIHGTVDTPTSLYRVRPKFLSYKELDCLTSRLRVPCPRATPTTEKQVLKAFNERNGDVPDIAGDLNGEETANNIVDTVVSYCFDRDLMKFYRDNPIQLSVESLESWKTGQPGSVLKQLEGMFNYEEVLRKDEYAMILKRIPKPKLEIDGYCTYSSPQTIAFQSKYVNAYFCPMVKEMKERVLAALNRNHLMYTDIDILDFEKIFNHRYPPASWKNIHQKFLELDMSKFDKSQGMLALWMEIRLLMLFGMPDIFIYYWVLIHAVTALKCFSVGFAAYLHYQRKSGDAMTFLGNTLFNMMSVLWVLLLLGCDINAENQFYLWSGDDSLLFINFDPIGIEHFISSLFNLEIKRMAFKTLYFCSKFVFEVNGRWIIIPDLWKLLIKIGRNDLVSYEHVEQYRVSLVDLTHRFNNILYYDAASLCMIDRYSVRIHSGFLMECIYKFVRSKEFKNNYYLAEGDILVKRTVNPKLEI